MPPSAKKMHELIRAAMRNERIAARDVLMLPTAQADGVILVRRQTARLFLVAGSDEFLKRTAQVAVDGKINALVYDLDEVMNRLAKEQATSSIKEDINPDMSIKI